MIEYDNNLEEMTMHCDGASCGRSQTFEGSFRSCIEDSKTYGWRQQPGDGSDWYHFCSIECERS